MAVKKNMEALNSQHCFRITTLDFTIRPLPSLATLPHLQSPPPPPPEEEGMTSALEPRSEVSASTTLSLSVLASPLTAL